MNRCMVNTHIQSIYTQGLTTQRHYIIIDLPGERGRKGGRGRGEEGGREGGETMWH